MAADRMQAVGVHDVFARNIWGRAVDGLIQAAGAVAQRGGRDHADGAGDHGSFVGKNVTEHVLRHDDVELCRVLHDLHRAVIDEHIGQLHVGVFFRQAVHDLLPKAARIEHIALFYGAQTVIALSCRLESDAADALDLRFYCTS